MGDFSDYGTEADYQEHAMGDMADYYIEQQIGDEFARPQVTRESIWTTATGRRVAIKDMEDSHLLNIIRCFRDMSPHGTRVAPTDPAMRRHWVNALANEAYRRGLTLEEPAAGEPVHE